MDNLTKSSIETKLNKGQYIDLLKLTDFNGMKMKEQLIQLSVEVSAADRFFDLQQIVYGIRNNFFLLTYSDDTIEPLVRRLENLMKDTNSN